MTPNPKKPPIRLNAKEYHELRIKVWMRAHCHCEVCHFWVAFDEMSIHHIKTRGSGGDDSEENSLCCHRICHPE